MEMIKSTEAKGTQDNLSQEKLAKTSQAKAMHS